MDWREKLDTMVTGYRDAMVLVAALKTGIFEALGAGPQSPAGVAADRGLDARATDIVLHALAASGVVIKDANGRFALAPGAEDHLLRDGTETMVNILGHHAGLMRNWLQLPDTLRSGQPAPRGERTDEELRDFICGMADISRRSSAEVAARVDLAGARRLLDLGGGPGTAAITFCRAFPGLSAVVFDLPAPVALAAEQIAAAGLAERISTIAGDFLRDDYGRDFDAVYVSNIIHMLGPGETAEVFRRCHRCLSPGGRILVKDFFLEPDRTRPAFAALFSVNMLTATERGRSYTRDETCDLLRAAGFGGLAAAPVAGVSTLITGNRES